MNDPAARTVEGSITTIVCQPGHRIFVSFQGALTTSSATEAVLVGAFRVTGGTRPFADLQGAGLLRGTLTCLPPILDRAGVGSCAELGAYRDLTMTMEGASFDPTA